MAENERRSEDDRCEGGSGEGEEGGAGGNGEEEVMERPGRLPCGARPGDGVTRKRLEKNEYSNVALRCRRRLFFGTMKRAGVLECT